MKNIKFKKCIAFFLTFGLLFTELSPSIYAADSIIDANINTDTDDKSDKPILDNLLSNIGLNANYSSGWILNALPSLGM